MRFIIPRDKIVKLSETELIFNKFLFKAQIETIKNIGGRYVHGQVTINPRLSQSFKDDGNTLEIEL